MSVLTKEEARFVARAESVNIGVPINLAAIVRRLEKRCAELEGLVREDLDRVRLECEWDEADPEWANMQRMWPPESPLGRRRDALRPPR